MPMIGAWYVGFHGERRARWWDWLSPIGYLHVVAFAYHPVAERWLVYDVGETHTILSALHPNRFDVWLHHMVENERMKVLRVETGQGLNFLHRLGFWCTPAVAHVIGLDSGAWRPIALYRDMLKRGAVPAFVRVEHGRTETPPEGHS